MPAPSHPPIFGTPEPLPRGPHTLTREQVADSQRARLLAAIAHLVGEHGYGAVTVHAVARRAGVSARTFYEHFDSKRDCMLAAYAAFASGLYARMAPALSVAGELPDVVHATLMAYLGTMEDNPLPARAFLVEMNTAGSIARQRRRDVNDVFAGVLRERHRELHAGDPSFMPPSLDVYRGVVHAIRELTCDAIEANATQTLPEMFEELLPAITAALEPPAR